MEKNDVSPKQTRLDSRYQHRRAQKGRFSLLIILVLSTAGLFFSHCSIDSDGDGVTDVSDQCPLDPNKLEPGQCGCGVVEGTCSNDTDSDNDGTNDQDDKCPTDPHKIQPGVCGCNVSDQDTDGDKTLDCNDECPNDPNKATPGECGCGVQEGSCTPNTDPIITASDENEEAGEGKEMAFDNDVDTKWLAFFNSAWIQVEFGGGGSKVLTAYTITSANDYPKRDPRDWSLKASNNGTHWTTLDTRSNEIFSRRYEKKPYLFSNSTAYRMYKLDITANKDPDSSNITQLAEIELFEDPDDIQIDPTPEGVLKIVIFSVGSSDASLFIFPNGKTMMVDSGTENACKNRVIPFLERHNIHHIDHYTDTHPHNDHDGGRGPLQASGHLTNATDIWHEENDYVGKWKYGDEFVLEGTSWFISNVKDFDKNGSDCNDNSLAFRMEYNGFVYSGTGDQGDNSQDYFLKDRPDLVEAHVRNTAHHMWGPVSRNFIKATNAFLYVVSNASDFGSGDGDMDDLLSAVDQIQGNGREHEIVVTGKVGHVIIRASDADDWSYEFCSDINSCVIPNFP